MNRADLPELLAYWRTKPAHSNEVAAAEIIDELLRALHAVESQRDGFRGQLTAERASRMAAERIVAEVRARNRELESNQPNHLKGPPMQSTHIVDPIAGHQVHLRESEKPIGYYAGPDGKLTAAILLPGEKKNVSWKDALAWAKDQGGDLPNRVEALLLFQHHRGEFQREVYWTNEQSADVSSYAWFQSFGYGSQDLWRQGNESMARAVRRVAI